MIQENRCTILGATVTALAIGGIAYYIIQDDRKVQRRKQGRRAEKTTLKLLQEIKQQELTIASNIEIVEKNIENQECTDAEFKKKEYALVHANELLLQLLEKLDAIIPLTIILGDRYAEGEATEFELHLISNIKAKKRLVIESIEGLFRRLDVANIEAKKESERRRAAQQEKEERERKIQEEEKEKERIRLEEEQKAKEEEAKIIAQQQQQQQEEEEAKIIAEQQQQQQEEEEEEEEEEEAKIIAQQQQQQRQEEEEEKEGLLVKEQDEDQGQDQVVTAATVATEQEEAVVLAA